MTRTSLHQLFDLSGKVALVTGGAMGIGQAIAFRLAEAGAAIAIVDLQKEQAAQTVDQLVTAGGKAIAIQGDVSAPSEVRLVVQQTNEQLGRLDILVNNAGIYPFSAALTLGEAGWDRVLGVNLKGAFFCAQAAAEQMMREGHGGTIINLSSVAAFRPSGNLVHYDATKAGLLALTKALALELAQYHIRVNAIAPGEILTPGAMAASGTLAQEGGVAVEEMTSPAFLARIPMRRLGEPDDVAKVALFLASAAADYMTGSCLVVDGGLLLT
jgi:2-deoxy-D-gluconate 3-dehydrogenase